MHCLDGESRADSFSYPHSFNDRAAMEQQYMYQDLNTWTAHEDPPFHEFGVEQMELQVEACFSDFDMYPCAQGSHLQLQASPTQCCADIFGTSAGLGQEPVAGTEAQVSFDSLPDYQDPSAAHLACGSLQPSVPVISTQAGDRSDQVPIGRGPRENQRTRTLRNMSNRMGFIVADPSASASPEKVPRKRGRPPKVRPEGAEAAAPATPTPAPKKRGRPPKKKPAAAEVEPSEPQAVETAAQPAAEPIEVDEQQREAIPVAEVIEAVQEASPSHAVPVTSERAATPKTQATTSAARATPAPATEATATPEPMSPTTARIRRSTRVRKPRVRDDELETLPISSTPTPSPRKARQREPSPAQEDAAMDVDLEALSATDQAASSEIVGPIGVSGDMEMTVPSARDVHVESGAKQTSGPVESAPVEIYTTPQAQASGSENAILTVEAGDTHTSEVGQQKRGEPDTPSVQLYAKRAKTSGPSSGYRARVNISQSRREKEVMRIIEEAGGIINVGTKEIFEAHAALVDSLIKAGEPTSTIAGSRIDKRTLESTLRELESQGKIKLVSTSVQNPAGVSRLVKVGYLADLSPEVLKSFLVELSRTQIPVAQPVVKTLDEPLEYGGSKTQKISRPAASVILLGPESGSQNDSQKAAKLLQSDDKTIQASLLTEPNTVMQLYGFICGKIARARALHLHTVGLFEAPNGSANLVSKEQRILHLSYYMQDIPVAVHCAVISCRAQNDGLVNLLRTPEGRQMPVGQLPASIADDLEVTRSRSRTRLMDLLDTLYQLGLIVPLQASQSQVPFLTCSPNDDHPTAFESTTYDGSATLLVPQYWHFKGDAPIHLWALSDQDPPFWKSVSVQDVTAASVFWEDLMRASIDPSFAKETVTSTEVTGTQYIRVEASRSLAKLLRRLTQWNSTYNFSWFQKQYLRQQQDSITANTPLQAEDSDARLEKIAEVVSAPKDEVRQFFESERTKLLRVIEKRHVRQKRDRTEEKAKRTADEKATLAQKAAAAQAQREKSWEEILYRVHPEPIKGSLATRIRQLRNRYMQTVGTTAHKWEAEIASVVEEAKRIPAKRATGSSKPPPFAHTPAQRQQVPLPPTLQSHDKPVEDLIVLQGSPLANRPAKKESKKKGKEKDTVPEAQEAEGSTRRRHRFQWNKDFDELARDAAVIIRARCRDAKRLDWGALERVFPAVPRNSVRQRISSLRDQPGAEAYFKRMEDRWYELWKRHLGAPELPDEDPTSPVNFDVIAHIKFLRNHVDKNALRVGFLQEELPITAALPSTADALCNKWDVVEKSLTSTMWDFMWNGTAEEGREKQFVQQAFLTCGNEIPLTKKYPSESIYVADAALKMTLGTPNEVYDPEGGSRVLVSVGEDPVRAAMSDLLERGAVSKVVRDPKKLKPGRLLKISEVNQNALGGPIREDLYQDAAALEDALSQPEGDWHDWPYTASDGDTAALIELVSANKIELKVDTTHPRAARANLDWNSKKTDDDDIETTIAVRLKYNSSRTPQSPVIIDVPVATSADDVAGSVDVHNSVNILGHKASCRRSSLSLVDCVTCLSRAKIETQASIQDEKQLAMYNRLTSILEAAGPTGVTKGELLASFAAAERKALATIISHMVGADVPLALWLGYHETVLVSSYHVALWSVVVAENNTHCTRILPRRWLDIDGRNMSEVWDAARRAVIGIVLFHPGISQAELRWRLRTIYDRQEVEEILAYLAEQAYLQRHTEDSYPFRSSPASNDEETKIFWMIGTRKDWYTV
ncbi:hypothetical protein NM688_g245 [Phlebia brevispora]|uniref:Uncharacterized protein n=1 Tax=Phlebia brevispora TaxID=194682 RepID=A0ACC1TF13_9APHY|nr:hypothetical protein NM688_g245 [Phlebia brevispora]